MCKFQKIYNILLKPLLFLALFSLGNQGYSQSQSENYTFIRISPGSFIQIRDSISFFVNDTLLRLPSSLVPISLSKNSNILFLDSLKLKASKKPLTKKIYDLVVISPKPVDNKKFTGSIDDSYINYTGKKIKNIVVIRMDVFGTDINNPAYDNPTNVNNLLNKTHANTSERIIRKNILFSVGDTISPLILSDNERILRELPFIDDARIIIVPVSDEEADIIVLTKDVYSLGAAYDFGGLKRGSLSLFDKNILGTGHELGLEIPFNSNLPNSPGIGGHYTINNIWKSFINLNVSYLTGLGETSYGFSLNRNLISATTKYAGGISIREMYTTVDFDTMLVAEPFNYNLQDYWLARSFLINKESVSRIILGARYTNNNVFDRPQIFSDSYYSLQNYRIYLGSAAFSIQKFYKTNLIYGYGRTEDIPYGGLFRITAGREFNEFKKRTYLGSDISIGRSFKEIGYIYTSLALGSFFNGKEKEQGILAINLNYFSNLFSAGRFRLRNFVNVDYSRGFGRYSDEYLKFKENNGFTGFSNDSIRGNQRFTLSLESVLFSPANHNGFRFAFFGFTDLGFLSGSNELIGNGSILSSIGLGLRIRNDNLLFNTLQIRLAFFPGPPRYSTINNITVSGEQLLRPRNFDPGPPSIIPYR